MKLVRLVLVITLQFFCNVDANVPDWVKALPTTEDLYIAVKMKGVEEAKIIISTCAKEFAYKYELVKYEYKEAERTAVIKKVDKLFQKIIRGSAFLATIKVLKLDTTLDKESVDEIMIGKCLAGIIEHLVGSNSDSESDSESDFGSDYRSDYSDSSEEEAEIRREGRVRAKTMEDNEKNTLKYKKSMERRRRILEEAASATDSARQTLESVRSGEHFETPKSEEKNSCCTIV